MILFIVGPKQGYSKENDTCYCYSNDEVKSIADIILENDMLKSNEASYIEKDSINNVNRVLMQGKINSLYEIIKLKDLQLDKLEKTGMQIIDNSWKWWQYTLAAIGAVTFGFTAGIVYENIRGK